MLMMLPTPSGFIMPICLVSEVTPPPPDLSIFVGTSCFIQIFAC